MTTGHEIIDSDVSLVGSGPVRLCLGLRPCALYACNVSAACLWISCPVVGREGDSPCDGLSPLALPLSSSLSMHCFAHVCDSLRCIGTAGCAWVAEGGELWSRRSVVLSCGSVDGESLSGR